MISLKLNLMKIYLMKEKEKKDINTVYSIIVAI